MKKIILVPDSFKGTLSAIQICDIMEEEILAEFPDCQVISLPVADGGEGTCDCFLQAVPGERVSARVTGPYFEELDAFYCLIDGGQTAIVEMAAAAGLPLVGDNKNPLLTTTYGVGELICHAVEGGAQDIVVGLGGSATTDCGAGLAAALGVIFRDKEGNDFVPTGGSMKDVVSIDTSAADKLLAHVRLRAMCDVNNPLHGPQGAAFIFGPQKGADPAMAAQLDDGLRRMGALLEQIPGKEDVCSLPGGGAAGGMGAGMYALLGFQLTPGIEAVLDVVKFDDLLDGCDLVITGEGRIDGQSLHGKVVAGVAGRAKKRSVPVCAIVGGALDEELSDARSMGVTSILTINRQPIPFSESKSRAPGFMRYTIRSLMGLLAACGQKQG